MRILLMPSSYAPIIGGVQTVAANLAIELKKMGHEVLVVTQKYPRDLKSREVLEGVEVQRLLLLKPSFDYLKRGRLDLLAASFYFYPAAMRELERIADDFKPDVINVHFAGAQVPFVLSLRKRFEFKLAVSLHGDDVERFYEPGNPRGDRRFFAVILKEADGITACSYFLLQRALALEPSAAKKSRVIYNGIDVEKFRTKDSFVYLRPYVLAYGRLISQKGFDLLLEAFAKIAPHYPEIDLILAGEGPEGRKLKALAAAKGIEKRIIFYGKAAAPEEISKLIHGSCLVAVPSRQESFGLAALEALAAGKPVLATKIGGMPEFLPADWLVEPDADSLRRGLEVFLGGEMQPHPGTISGQFNLETMGKSYERFYEKILGKEAGSDDCN